MKTRVLLSALLVIAAASIGRAGLIYSGVQNIAIPQTFDGVYFHLTNGASTGTFPASWSTEPRLNPFFGGVDVGNSPLLRPVVLGTGADPEQIVNLSAGTAIDSGSGFVAGESGSGTHTGAGANQFHIGTPGLLGFEFQTTIGGPEYYGWLRMTENNAGAGTIVDWAYGNVAGEAVQAGISAVPEPATVLTGLALCGVAVLRRRRVGQEATSR